VENALNAGVRISYLWAVMTSDLCCVHIVLRRIPRLHIVQSFYFTRSTLSLWVCNCFFNFFMFCWLCILVQQWVSDQLDAQLRYITVYYYNPLHVLSNSMLIIRRSNCINTTSGIVLSVHDRPVCRLRRISSTCTPDGHLQRILYQMLY